MELSITWVNGAADTRRSPLAAAVVATHSAARLEAVYISGEYGRSALPVDAHTTWGTPAAAAAVSTLRAPSTLVVTVPCTSTSARAGERCAAGWKMPSGLPCAMIASIRARSLASPARYSAPACRGQPLVTPRLTPTRRPGR